MDETIHTRIKSIRSKRELSMEALAAQVGVTWQTIQQWENGSTAPKRTRLAKVASVLGTTPQYLLTGADVIERAQTDSTLSLQERRASYDTKKSGAIAEIVALLESMSDIGVGEVLRCAKEAAKAHAKLKAKKGER